MRRFALLVVLVSLGCTRETPPAAQPSRSTMYPEQRGVKEQQRLQNSPDKPDGFHEAMIALTYAHDAKCKEVGVDAANEWMHEQLHDKTPEQFAAEWKDKFSHDDIR